MKAKFTAVLAATLCMLGVSTTNAVTYLLDDSKSTVLDTHLAMQWRSLSPASNDHQVQGTTRVQVRLDTRAYVGKLARVYMALPSQPGNVVRARWLAQGPLLSGELASGQRGLVWSGVVPTATMEDVFTVTIQTDGRLLSTSQSLRFYFEVDVP